jgi:hypothetical protein
MSKFRFSTTDAVVVSADQNPRLFAAAPVQAQTLTEVFVNASARKIEVCAAGSDPNQVTEKLRAGKTGRPRRQA